MPNPHNCTGSVDGGCLDCGATHIEIYDGLAPTCEKVTGPNRLALIAIAREMRTINNGIEEMRSRIASCENTIAQCHHGLSDLGAKRAALLASIAALNGNESDKPLPLAEAVGRL